MVYEDEEYSEYSEESETEGLSDLEKQVAERQRLAEAADAAALAAQLISDSDVSQVLSAEAVEEIQDSFETKKAQLRLKADQILELGKNTYAVSTNLRYSNLLFLPSHSWPESAFTTINSQSLAITLDWYNAPVVEIYAHTPAAPEFWIVDELVNVRDITGDGFGFEEAQGIYSASTSTFNETQNPTQGTITPIKVRLDRRIFDNGPNDCYAYPRIYELTYASGHVEVIHDIILPSPCFQNYKIDGSATDPMVEQPWHHSYCTNEDYRSWRSTIQPTTPGTLVGNLVVAKDHNGITNPQLTRFPWPAMPTAIFSSTPTIGFDISTYGVSGQYTDYPSLGIMALQAYAEAGINPSSTNVLGGVELGSPLRIAGKQVTSQEMLMLPRKYWMHWVLQPTGMVNSNNQPYSKVDGGDALLHALQSATGQSMLQNNQGQPISARPAEGEYAVVRQYVYSENLDTCTATPPIDIEVCMDNQSPSYYQTTEEDCNGVSITNYINGTNGINWVPVPGPAGCCSVDCSGFIMTTTHTNSSYNGNDATISIDFTNGTGTPIGNPDTDANEGAYKVQVIHSGGTAITHAAGGQFPISGNFTVASCDTVINNSFVACNSNNKITVGMEVTGTGITGTAYVGAVTGGEPGACTQFQLSSDPASLVPVNAASNQTNTTLTFCVGQHRFTWGSLPPVAGTGDYYTVRVTDLDGCVYEANHTPDEASPVVGCTDNTAINYSSANQQLCLPNCCLFCDTVSGDIEDANSGFISELLANTQDSSQPVSTISSTDGSITVAGSIYSGAAPYLTSTMSYKYTLYSLPALNDFANAGSALSTSTSTLTQGVGKSFTSLGYGFYGVKIEIEDSSTGSDAGLEKCYTWIGGFVRTPVCTDSTATNYSTYASVHPILQIPDNSLCTYPTACACGIDSMTVVTTQCSPSVLVTTSCSPNSSYTWEWVDSSGAVLTSGVGTNVANSQHVIASNFIPAVGTYTFVMTDNSAGGSCTTQNSITVNFPICGCMDSTALNYNPAATVSGGAPCIYCQYGCTDATAVNYDPNATCDDGTCYWPVLGCTDPTASNYNPVATQDDGSCLWEGCLDQTAINPLHDCNNNYNANINVNNISCCNYCVDPTVSSPVITPSSITTGCVGNSDGAMSLSAISNNACPGYDLQVKDPSGTVVFTATNINNGVSQSTGNILSPGSYTYVVTDNCTTCEIIGVFSVGTTGNASCGCTDPNAVNYNTSATIDDGSCQYPGCMDPNASNYNPSAIVDDGSCQYNIISNPCTIPNREYNSITTALKSCLTLKGATYLQKIKIGYSDDCSIMNQWKLVLVNYLLGKKDLDCIYNCSDSMTSLNTTVASDCASLASQGGAVTGVNDQGHAGSTYSTSTGTVVTDPTLYFIASNTLYPGDVITMPSGLIWKNIGGTLCTSGCAGASINPELATGQGVNPIWEQCTASSTWTTSETTNYLDPFTKFMNEMCTKCVNDPDCLNNREAYSQT